MTVLLSTNFTPNYRQFYIFNYYWFNFLLGWQKHFASTTFKLIQIYFSSVTTIYLSDKSLVSMRALRNATSIYPLSNTFWGGINLLLRPHLYINPAWLQLQRTNDTYFSVDSITALDDDVTLLYWLCFTKAGFPQPIFSRESTFFLCWHPLPHHITSANPVPTKKKSLRAQLATLIESTNTL